MKEFFANLTISKKTLIIFCSLLSFVLLITYIFYIPAVREGKAIRSKYPHLNPALDLFAKENMIVDFQGLRVPLINKYEQRDDYLISIYFEYLPTGANIAINKDERMWPASLIKIPVAMTAMKKIQDKEWDLANELVVMDEDKDSSFGEMYKEDTGTTHSIRQVLEKSLIESDNTAHFMLLRNIDNSELESVYEHLGMDDIIDTLKKTPSDVEADNKITAKRYTIFFRSLYNATFLDREYSELFLDILSRSPKEFLSAGLPSDVRFVHKTGIRSDEGVRADAGIVYAKDRPYLITVMIQKKNKQDFATGEAEALFKAISQEIYSYVANHR